MAGPLDGVRVVELAGIGPGPFTAMMLADMGADVVRIDRATKVRPEEHGEPHPDLLNRGRRSLAVDLKHPDGRDLVLRLAGDADVLIEGWRPGVAERLGIGPDDCRAVNPRLVYARMTGWGQDGPLAPRAGHDIDYIALTGALHAIGRAGERPVPPLNLVGDFGGGGMLCAFGIVCALFEASASGEGQVVDAAMVDGVAVLTTAVHAYRAMGAWSDERGVNPLDSGAPFYDVYACADGCYLAVGALEPQFYDELVRRTGFLADVPEAERPEPYDPATWPEQKQAWAELFATRTRDAWVDLLGDTDTCVAPVLSWDEAPRHPHLAARGTYVEHAGRTQPAPAPRFSRTPGAIARPAPHPGEHTEALLREMGLGADDVSALRESGAVA
ncbi:MAG: CaiB/BaiF CoA transferase family protein [Actinomycetes bacterium]